MKEKKRGETSQGIEIFIFFLVTSNGINPFLGLNQRKEIVELTLSDWISREESMARGNEGRKGARQVFGRGRRCEEGGRKSKWKPGLCLSIRR